MQTKRKNARTKGKKGIDHKCTTITVNRLHTMPFFLTRLHWRIHDIIFKTSISTKEDGIKKILKIQNKKEKNRIKIFFFGGGVSLGQLLFSPPFSVLHIECTEVNFIQAIPTKNLKKRIIRHKFYI